MQTHTHYTLLAHVGVCVSLSHTWTHLFFFCYAPKKTTVNEKPRVTHSQQIHASALGNWASHAPKSWEHTLLSLDQFPWRFFFGSINSFYFCPPCHSVVAQQWAWSDRKLNEGFNQELDRGPAESDNIKPEEPQEGDEGKLNNLLHSNQSFSQGRRVMEGRGAGATYSTNDSWMEVGLVPSALTHHHLGEWAVTQTQASVVIVFYPPLLYSFQLFYGLDLLLCVHQLVTNSENRSLLHL